jgi:hypothetical protein
MTKSTYYQQHREHALQKAKDYYYTNKERLNAKYTCSCGRIIAFQNRRVHERSKYHRVEDETEPTNKEGGVKRYRGYDNYICYFKP